MCTAHQGDIYTQVEDRFTEIIYMEFQKKLDLFV